MIVARLIDRLKFPGILAAAFQLQACIAPISLPAQRLEADCTEVEWQHAWTVQAKFRSPESAAIDANTGTIFVSNVNGYRRDGEGFISRLSLTGDLLELHWLDGLNAPTGLRVVGETLWVVDFDRIVQISIPDQTILHVYPAPDESPLLNDLFVTDDGTVFVTGSASSTVYVLSDKGLVVWRRDSELLKNANGISADSDHVYVAGYTLVAIDRSNLAIERIAFPTELVDLEGVLSDPRGGWLVSRVGNYPLAHLDEQGRITPLVFGESYVADFDTFDDFIVAPVSPEKVAGFSKMR